MSHVVGLRCPHCGTRFPIAPMHEGCPACTRPDFRSGLTPEYDLASVRERLEEGMALAGAGPGIWRYRTLLPLGDGSPEVSLGEGDTALVELPMLAEELGAAGVWMKDESGNPTWSFKDRNAAVTVAMAVRFEARIVVASSSGNHGAAVSAYAARAGLECVVVTYPGISRAAANLIRAYGARLAITTREGRWVLLRSGVSERGWYPATNFTEIPTSGAYGHEGYKTIAYELHEQMDGETPDLVVVPTAYAEGLFGIWKGFDELVGLGLASSVPRFVAAEPAGGPLRIACEAGRLIARVEPQPTIARGIGAAVNSYFGTLVLDRSGGLVAQAGDAEISRAQIDLARQGLFVEPAAAVGLAGLRRLAADGDIARGARIVMIGTSAGLKNPGTLTAPIPGEIAPTLAAFDAAAGDAAAEPVGG